MTSFITPSRRTLLRGAAAGGLVAAAGLPVTRAFAADLVVGFIYVGPRDDYGYNQAQAEGAAALKKLAGVKVVEEEKVPETIAVEKTMESMINLDGAKLVFPTSFGYYNPHMLKMAKKYGSVRFEHCGGLWAEGAPKNAGSYFGYHVNQAPLAPKGYLTGAEWAWAGLFASMVDAVKTGKPIPNLVRGGLKEGLVKTSAYGPAVGEAARKQADAVKARFLDSGFVIFKGPLKDNKGTVVIPAGQEQGQTDLRLESMNYLVEGVLGALA